MAGSRRDRLLLLDGYSLVYRAHHAMSQRPLRTTRGENTTVPWGVTRLLRRLLAQQAPSHAAFVLDAPGGAGFRRALYASYKPSRELAGEQLAPSEFGLAMTRVRQLFEALRIEVLEVEGFEADDVIGTLALQATQRGLDAVIVSSDTDFYQLVGEHVFVVEPGRSGRAFIEPRWVDRAAATERMGIAPERLVDFLALVGDPSDNVPGVRGIGPRTALEMLDRYGSLDTVLAHAGELRGKRAREALQREADTARMSRELVTLRTDVPVPLALPALRMHEPDRPRLRALFQQLEFNSLLPELTPARTAGPENRIVRDAEQLARLAAEAHRQRRMALEILGDPDSAGGLRLAGLAIALPRGPGFYLPLGHRRAPNLPVPADPAMAPLRETLASPQIEKHGHELARFLEPLRRAGLEVRGPLFDAAVMAHGLSPIRRAFDLETLAVDLLGRRLAGAVHGRFARDLAPDEASAWAGPRAEAALLLCARLRDELTARDQLRVYEQLDAPILPVLSELQASGLSVDRDALEELRRRLAERGETLRREVDELAGARLNPDSPAQLRRVLFEQLRLPVKKRTRTGPSADAEVLAALAAEGHPLPARILELRQVSKLLKTRLEPAWARIDPATGRLHPRYSQTELASGRVTMAEPRLRGPPESGGLEPSMRAAIIAPENGLLLAAGYQQLELRLLAHLSGEELLLESFRAGRDVHREVAGRFHGVPVSRVTEGMRATARALDEATVAGEEPGGLAERMDLDLAEAEALFERYLEALPAVRAWRDEQLLRALREGHVTTLFGRRRDLPELRLPNWELRALGRALARSAQLEGSAADLLKFAMMQVHRGLRARSLNSRLLMQLGDELLVEVAPGELEEVAGLVRDELERAATLDVPLVANLGAGRSWLLAGLVRIGERPWAAEAGELHP